MEEALQLLEASPEPPFRHGGPPEEGMQGMQGSTRIWLHSARSACSCRCILCACRAQQGLQLKPAQTISPLVRSLGIVRCMLCSRFAAYALVLCQSQRQSHAPLLS